jgi:hypothetical protein
MEIENVRMNTELNLLEKIKNLPMWLKSAKSGDKLFFKSENELASALNITPMIIERINVFKAKGRELFLTEEAIKYLEMTDGEYFGVFKGDKGDNIQCHISWLVENEYTEREIFVPYSIVAKKPTPANLLEMINLVDKKRFESMLRYANMGRPISDGVVTLYLENWAKSKWDLFLLFGNKLSISFDSDYEIDEKEMCSLQITLMKKYLKYAALLDGIPSQAFTTNQLNSSNWNPQWLIRTGTQFTSGVKTSKFLSNLLNDAEFDIDLSKMLQNRTIKGKFCISIDPYDFLTISTNKHGWNSCCDFSNARNNGTNGGSFSYMIDGESMVAYRTNGQEYEYSGKGSFSGNSKYWRQMIHINKENCAMLFNRQYPQNADNKTSTSVREFLEKQISEYLKRPDSWDINKGDKWYQPTVRIAYNDSGRDRMFVIPTGTPMKDVKIESGSKIFCLSCGTRGDKAACCGG